MRTFLPAALISAGMLLPGTLQGQANPYRGLWVGEVKLGAVNEVTVPLDAANIPRAPNPAVPTKTFDAANLRLILHVNGAGQVSLLKQVAILNRKAGALKSENDAALVTDERLYGSFPPQPAQRIASVVFDFGDSKATAAVDAVVNAAVTAAAASVNAGGNEDAAKAAALAAAADVIAKADAAERFAAFLRDSFNTGAVTALANGGSAATAQTAATALQSGSFYSDSRGTAMIAAVQTALAALPAGATAGQKNKAAQNAAAAYADVDNNYQRFISGELFGDMISAAAETAATAAAATPRKPATTFTGTDGTAPVIVTSAGHQLSTGNVIMLSGASVAAYNGVHSVTRINADLFSLPGPLFVSGKAITAYQDTPILAPAAIVSPGHGVQTGDRVTVSGSATAGYNGVFFATRIDDTSFSIPVTFVDDPATRGKWSTRSGAITDFAAAPAGGSGVKITSPNHGLNNGEQIEIAGAGAAVYNGLRTVTRIDANSFTIPVAFGGNPIVKGTWSVKNDIAAWQPPAEKPTTVASAAHGLGTGDTITISGSGKDAYNGDHTVNVVDADSFTIPVPFSAVDGNPAGKGSWAPAFTGSWRLLAPIRTASAGNAKVNDARAEALRIKVTAYDDTRGTDAIDTVLAAIENAAAASEATGKGEIQIAAETAGRLALAELVSRNTNSAVTPTLDYTAFIRASDSRFIDFKEIAPLVAAAAASGAVTEKSNVLSTAASVANKAKERAIGAIPAVYASAARAVRTELPLTGNFGPGQTGLTGTVILPANHPTNPFRHRRHPDHTTGFDITRVLTLGFDGASGDTPAESGFGVSTITGTYAEEIFGLHKPLGPAKDTGLKVLGTFTLHRISLIDALNAR
jgi:hypothetical protein